MYHCPKFGFVLRKTFSDEILHDREDIFHRIDIGAVWRHVTDAIHVMCP
jgi:hypothetical protein